MRSHEKTGFRGSTGYNGKYNDPAYQEKISLALKCTYEKIKAPKNSFVVSCTTCQKEIVVVEGVDKFPSKQKYFCSRGCANKREFTEERNKKISESMTGRVYVPNIETTRKCSCGIEFICKVKDKRSYCSRSCATRFSQTHVEKRKQAREKRPALINYRKDCAFKFNLADYPDEFDFKLIEQYGWYSAKNRGNNLTGVSRDHLVSIRYGFDNNVRNNEQDRDLNRAFNKDIKNDSTDSLEKIVLKIDPDLVLNLHEDGTHRGCYIYMAYEGQQEEAELILKNASRYMTIERGDTVFKDKCENGIILSNIHDGRPKTQQTFETFLTKHNIPYFTFETSQSFSLKRRAAAQLAAIDSILG
jgi:hypothetical protein